MSNLKKGNLKKVRWAFDNGNTYDGYTDGTRWNGWINIWMNRDTYLVWMKDMREEYKDEDKHYLQDMEELEPCENGEYEGLYSIAYGYTPSIVEEEE